MSLLSLPIKIQDKFTSIIQDGYTVKFITIRGLQTLLQLKFDKIEERDYKRTDKGISGLQIEEDQLLNLKQMLSKNCRIHELSSKEVSIELG